MAFRDLPLVERRVTSQKKGELRDLSGRMESDAGAYQGQYECGRRFRCVPRKERRVAFGREKKNEKRNDLGEGTIA